MITLLVKYNTTDALTKFKDENKAGLQGFNIIAARNTGVDGISVEVIPT
jgi:hypothetical protein